MELNVSRSGKNQENLIRTQVIASKMEEEDCIQEIRLGIIKK